MNDADLRALERATQAAPNDLHAGLSLAAGLDRAGRRRDAFLVRCRLAHGGHELAAAEVERAVAEVAGGDLLATQDVTAGPPVIARRSAAFEADALETTALGFGDRLVLRSGRRLQALRPDLSVAWSTADSGGWAARCDDAVVHAIGPQRLALRRVDDGEVLALAEVPVPANELVAAWGDRLVLGAGRTARGELDARGVDLGHDFGRVAWSRTLPRDEVHGGGGQLAVRTDEGPIEVRALGDGRTLARIGRLAVAPEAGSIDAAALAAGLLVIDASEAVSSARARRPAEPESAWVAVRVGNDGRLARRWRHERPGERTADLVLDATRVVACVHDLATRDQRLVAIDRQRGELQWTTTPGTPCARLFLRGSTVVERTALPASARVRLIDSTTGAVRADVRLPEQHADVLPFAGGIAVLGVDGDLYLISWPRRTS